MQRAWQPAEYCPKALHGAHNMVGTYQVLTTDHVVPLAAASKVLLGRPHAIQPPHPVQSWPRSGTTTVTLGSRAETRPRLCGMHMNSCRSGGGELRQQGLWRLFLKQKSPRREVVRSSAGAGVVYPPFWGSFA